MLVRVALDKSDVLKTLTQGRFDIPIIVPDQFADIVADDYDFLRLIQAGLNPAIIHADLVAFYQSRFPLAATMGGFPTLAEAITRMDSLHTLYPSLVTARDSIGYSYQGRPLWVMKISDNVDVDEDEPEVFINALIHAREPMGLEATLRFMRHLCYNYGSDSLITRLVDTREFYFLPVINPDGYEYNRQIAPNGGGMWRKNRHDQGIDLNRNWGYQWGYDDDGSSPYPNDETYRGSAPFSEPETAALRQFVNSRHFAVSMNFHTYGNYFLYPWGYFNGYTDDHSIFTGISDSATAENGYAPGTPWELLYNTNGDALDWQYGEQAEKPKVIGFTMEIGDWMDGFWPQPSRIPTLWVEALSSLLYLARIADNPFAIGLPAAPVLNPIGDIFADSFTVTWEHTDSINPAVAFELKELSGMQEITDDFEGELDEWSLDGFGRLAGRHHSGTSALFSGSDNNYTGTATMVNAINVDIDDTLQFWTWFSIESGYDYAYVRLSNDGGQSFANIEGNITTNSDPNGLNEGNGITGYTSGWELAKFPLGPYAGQSVIIGLRYKTDGGVLMEGFYADDLHPLVVFQQENILGSDITDHFFQITGRLDGEYYYTVRARDSQQQYSVYSNTELAIVHNQVGIGDVALPGGLALTQNYPNPFNPSTAIAFELPMRAHAELSVYDITGARIATLVDAILDAGRHRYEFNSENGSDRQLASGVYFYRLKTDESTLTRKMTLMK
jgi:hypothetical protein